MSAQSSWTNSGSHGAACSIRLYNRTMWWSTAETSGHEYGVPRTPMTVSSMLRVPPAEARFEVGIQFMLWSSHLARCQADESSHRSSCDRTGRTRALHRSLVHGQSRG